jgi:hypothetical protein
MVLVVKVLSDLIVMTLLESQTQHQLDLELEPVETLVRIQTKYITHSS